MKDSCFKQGRSFSILRGRLLKLVDKFIYLDSNISSTERDVNICLVKASTSIDRLLIIPKTDLLDKIKRDFFQTVSILLFGCSTWSLTKCMEKRLDGNYIRMLCAILNKSWKQHPTKQQLYSHLSPSQNHPSKMCKTCWTSKNKLICQPLHMNVSEWADQ